jgi:cytochrome c oxidase subunit II
VAAGAAALLLAACRGEQSALEPAGRGAEQIATLFWVMVAGGALIWLAVVAVTIYAIRIRPKSHDDRTAKLLIIGGGAVFPTIVLGILLAWGLAMLPGLLAPPPEGSLEIAVSGEQWWWRVTYLSYDGTPLEVETANEIHLPVGEPVQFELDSPDVIHSFWIPSLGGKMDMIPGRTNVLTLHPTRTGTFRGACAEYCGASHALMSLWVVVEEKEAFERWLAKESSPAREPTDAVAASGRELFLSSGCGACHAVRGTEADGVVGPDLTHVGSRLSLGAGTFSNDPVAFRAWIRDPERIKPEVKMPAFGMLGEEGIAAIARWLEGLE